MGNGEKKFFFSLIVIAGLFLPLKTFSQEYKFEIGGIAGSSFYMGDANKTKLYLNPEISGGALFRNNLNFHWAIKANLLTGKVSGDTKDSDNIFPLDQNIVFNRTFTELGVQVEFNFLPYSDKYSYTGTKPYSPYVFIGAGVTYASGKTNFIGLNMPLGIGFKYKVKNRVNIGIEFSMRKLFADDFDEIENPYNIKSSLIKNQDWYSLTMIFLTWEFGYRADPCRGM